MSNGEAKPEGANGFPVFEPLSEATRQKIKPLENLPTNEYLLIWRGNDTSFHIKPVKIHPFKEDECPARWLFKAGYRMQALAEENGIQTSTTGLKFLQLKTTSRAARNFMYRIPEQKHLGEKFWQKDGEFRVAATDFSVIMINECWPKDKILFLDEESYTLYRYLLIRFLSQNVRANAQAQFKLNEIVPEMPKDFDEHPDPDLRLSEYQKVAMLMGLEQEAIGLFMDKGTGKTAVEIAKVCLEAKRTVTGKLDGNPRMMRTLVICPNQVRYNWQNEFSRFATSPGKVTIIRGPKLQRIRLLTEGIRTEDDCAFSAIVIGIDTASNDADILGKIHWDRIILDESHYIKSVSTKRYKKLTGELRDCADRRSILTGTPIANVLFDIFGQFEFLGEGLSGFTTFKNFVSFHGQFEDAKFAGDSVQRLVSIQNIPLIQERLARLTFSITKEEAKLNLPDKVFDTWEVEMTKQQKEMYKKLATQLAIEIEEVLRSSKMSKRMVADHILTRLLRLAQITSGYATWETDTGKYDEDGIEIVEKSIEQINKKNPKVEAVLEMLTAVDKDPNEKAVIWACFREDIRVISQALTEAGIVHGTYFGDTSEKKREENVDRFNNDETFKVLVCNPASAGEGLNLIGYNPDRDDQETYCGHVIYFSQNWSFIQRSQSEDRAHRRGTKMNVRITDLMVPGTIDEEIRARVRDKGTAADLIQDIKDILEDVLNYEFSGI